MPLVNTRLLIYLMRIAEALDRAQLGIKLDSCWCRVSTTLKVFRWGAELQAMLDVMRHMSRWKMKFNSRKDLVVGKRDAGVSLKLVGK